jgi:hypothetical protein
MVSTFRTRLLRILLVALFFPLSIAQSMDFPFETYQWEHRLLLVRGDSKASAKALRTALEGAAEDIAERHILWFVAGPDDLFSNASPLPEEKQRDRIHAALMQQKLPDERVLLIGKDGGVKGRYDALDLAGIFTRIDGMPMRRAEMRRQQR